MMRNAHAAPAASTADFARQLANVVAIPLGIAASFVLVPFAEAVAPRADTFPGQSGLLPLARWAFALRLVLFVGQLAYAFHQSLPHARTNAVLRRIGWLTALDAVLGGAWLGAWALGRPDVALGLLGASLLTLLLIELRRRDGARVGIELLVVRIPYSLALGWTAVLAVAEALRLAGAADALAAVPVPPLALAVAVVAAVCAFAVSVTHARPNLAFGVAVAWGFAGIFDAARAATPVVAVAALLGMLAVVATVLATIVELARSRRGAALHLRALADA